ncbi:hypothetical protein, partial [Acinetobacter baumannii]|uniref:hypothetical protein n=1 Tax=Acinetobacter baumannii TaxID=470 RepID=UPI00148910B8
AKQFLHRVGFAPKQRFRKADVDVHLNDHVAELAFPDGIEHGIARSADLIIAFQRQQGRQPELGLIVDLN